MTRTSSSSARRRGSGRAAALPAARHSIVVVVVVVVVGVVWLARFGQGEGMRRATEQDRALRCGATDPKTESLVLPSPSLLHIPTGELSSLLLSRSPNLLILFSPAFPPGQHNHISHIPVASSMKHRAHPKTDYPSNSLSIRNPTSSKSPSSSKKNVLPPPPSTPQLRRQKSNHSFKLKFRQPPRSKLSTTLKLGSLRNFTPLKNVILLLTSNGHTSAWGGEDRVFLLFFLRPFPITRLPVVEKKKKFPLKKAASPYGSDSGTARSGRRSA